MKFIRFDAGGGPCFGIVEGDTVQALSRSPFDSVYRSGESHPLSKVRILAPCRPSKIFAIAYNYVGHAGGADLPTEPQVFLKLPTSIIGPGEPIVIPRAKSAPPYAPAAASAAPAGGPSAAMPPGGAAAIHGSAPLGHPWPGRIDEEAELVVVIGRRCRGVRREDALSCVFGYTCGNDVSARTWQKNDRNWWRAKAADSFAPLGPAIVTDFDSSQAYITARINGSRVQECRTQDMIFDVPSLIEWISDFVTLEPGDCIFTGTAAGPAEIHAGDTVEVEIEGIGVLSNPVKE